MKSDAVLSVRTFGELNIVYGGIDVTGSISAKARAMICYLTVEEKNSFSRNRLASMLWDDSSQEASQYNLRFTVWKLNKYVSEELGAPEIIDLGRDHIAINSDIQVETDAHRLAELEETVDAGVPGKEMLQGLKSIYRGEFLGGYDSKNSITFNDWLYIRKEKYQEVYLETLKKMSERYVSQGNDRFLIDIYTEMLRLNPYLEDVHIMLIRQYIGMSDRSAALKQYQHCCTLLREELNIPPTERIRAVYKEIMSGHSPSAGNASVSAAKVAKAASNVHNKGCAEDHRSAATVEGDFLVIHRSSASMSVPDRPESENAADLVISPGSVNLRYYLLYNLIEEILNVYRQKELNKVPASCWRDLLSIDSRIESILDEDMTVRSVETIRLYSSLFRALETLASQRRMSIYIYNIKSIDEDSLNFLLFYIDNYFIRRGEKPQIRIHIQQENSGDALSRITQVCERKGLSYSTTD